MNCPRCQMKLHDPSRADCEYCGHDISRNEFPGSKVDQSTQSRVVHSEEYFNSKPNFSASASHQPLRLEINPGHCVPRTCGSISFRLSNAGLEPLDVVVRIIPQKGLSINGLPEFPLKVPSDGNSIEKSITFQTPTAGSPLIAFFVEIENFPPEELEQTVALHIPVNQAPAHVSVRLGDQVKGDELKIDRSITHLNFGGSTETKLKTDHWSSLPLQPSDGRKRFLEARPENSRRTDRLTLSINAPSRWRRDVCLLAGNKFSLGRSDTADIRLLTSKTTDPTGEISRQISRDHAELRTESEKWIWQDRSSRGTAYCGEIFGTQDHTPEASRRTTPRRNSFYFVNNLGRDSIIAVGAHLELVPERFATESPLACFRQSTLRQLGIELPITELPRTAVRLGRTDDLADIEEIVIFPLVAEIGHPEVCPIPLAGLPGSVARIIHLAGCFWIESLSATYPLAINGEPLELHHLAPMYSGQFLTIHDYQITVKYFTQHIANKCECHPSSPTP